MKIINNKKGFTLVEIMIVVLIISLLASIAIPYLLRAQVNANQASAQTSLKSISTALENYMAINTVYPTDPNVLITANPPYLNKNFFAGIHNGYTFNPVLAQYSYNITAYPITASTGNHSYSVATGGVLTED